MEKGVDVVEQVFWAEGGFQVAAAVWQPVKLQSARSCCDEVSREVGGDDRRTFIVALEVERKEGLAAAVVAPDDAVQGERVGDPEKAAGLGGKHLATGKEEERFRIWDFRF